MDGSICRAYPMWRPVNLGGPASFRFTACMLASPKGSLNGSAHPPIFGIEIHLDMTGANFFSRTPSLLSRRHVVKKSGSNFDRLQIEETSKMARKSDDDPREGLLPPSGAK